MVLGAWKQWDYNLPATNVVKTDAVVIPPPRPGPR